MATIKQPKTAQELAAACELMLGVGDGHCHVYLTLDCYRHSRRSNRGESWRVNLELADERRIEAEGGSIIEVWRTLLAKLQPQPIDRTAKRLGHSPSKTVKDLFPHE